MSRTADDDIRWMNSILERARATDEHGHGLCPWCGGEARMEAWPVAEHLLVSPTCMTCGFDPPTATPAAMTLGQWSAMTPERRALVCDVAWEAWDRAWWRR